MQLYGKGTVQNHFITMAYRPSTGFLLSANDNGVLRERREAGLLCIPGTVPKIGSVRPIEGGIVLVTADGKNLCGLLLLQQLPCQHQPFDGDIVSYGCAGGLPEPLAKLGPADKKPITKRLNGQIPVQIFVDIADQPVFQSVRVIGGLLFPGEQFRKLL